MFQFNSVLPLNETTIIESNQQKSLLFEAAVVLAEMTLINDDPPSLLDCVTVAVGRQRRHFDARSPVPFDETDEQIVRQAANNLINMLSDFSTQRSVYGIVIRPEIPGFGWIGSGVGDFAIDDTLVEVKYSDRNFIANDYRQILMYWILSYAKSLEGAGKYWSHFLLINPRLNRASYGSFDTLISSASGGLSRVEVYEYLRAIIMSSTEIRK